MGTAASRVRLIRPEFVDQFPPAYRECLDAAMAVIERECVATLSAEDVARAVGKSRRHLDRVFRAIHGMTVQQYTVAARLDLAARLLQKGLKVDAVVEGAGFGSRRQFYRVFERRFGVTPRVFRGGRKSDEPQGPPSVAHIV